MNDEHQEIFLSVKDDYLSNKKVDYVGYAATKFVGHGTRNGSNPQRVFKKSEFIDFLRNDIGMKKTKAYDCFKALEDIGLIRRTDDGSYVADKETAPFLKLYRDTVRYFFDHYKPIHFKVYCYLLNKYNLHRAYGYDENYFFSTAELLRTVGYNDRKFDNVKLMNEVLIDLENNHFIHYDHDAVGRPGKRGRYKELYHVSTVAENSKEAFRETVMENDCGPRWYNGERWVGYNRESFEDADIMANFMLERPENANAVRYAMEKGHVPAEYRDRCEDYLRNMRSPIPSVGKRKNSEIQS